MRPTQADLIRPDRLELHRSPELFAELVLDTLERASCNLIAVQLERRARAELLLQPCFQSVVREFNLAALEILDHQLDDAKALQPPESPLLLFIASGPCTLLLSRASFMEVSMLRDRGSRAPAGAAICNVSESLVSETDPGKERVQTFTLVYRLDDELEAIAHIALFQDKALVLVFDLLTKLSSRGSPEFAIPGPITILTLQRIGAESAVFLDNQMLDRRNHFEESACDGDLFPAPLEDMEAIVPPERGVGIR